MQYFISQNYFSFPTHTKFRHFFRHIFLTKYFHNSSLIYVPLLQVIPMSVQQPFIFLFILINTILIRLPSHLITLKTITITWPHTLIWILPLLTMLILYLNFSPMTNSFSHTLPLLFLLSYYYSWVTGCYVYRAPSFRS